MGFLNRFACSLVVTPVLHRSDGDPLLDSAHLRRHKSTAPLVLRDTQWVETFGRDVAMFLCISSPGKSSLLSVTSSRPPSATVSNCHTLAPSTCHYIALLATYKFIACETSCPETTTLPAKISPRLKLLSSGNVHRSDFSRCSFSTLWHILCARHIHLHIPSWSLRANMPLTYARSPLCMALCVFLSIWYPSLSQHYPPLLAAISPLAEGCEHLFHTCLTILSSSHPCIVGDLSAPLE